MARNVASLVSNRPHGDDARQDAVVNCWTADDAAAFIRVAREAGPRQAAFYGVALDAGCGKSELAGLMWSDVNFAEGRIVVRQQLLTGGREPVFIPTKGKRARSIDLAAGIIDLLRVHKQRQAEIRLRNGPAYHDHGLVFAKDWTDVQRKYDSLGDLLNVNNLGQREFVRLIAQPR